MDRAPPKKQVRVKEAGLKKWGNERRNGRGESEERESEKKRGMMAGRKKTRRELLGYSNEKERN